MSTEWNDNLGRQKLTKISCDGMDGSTRSLSPWTTRSLVHSSSDAKSNLRWNFDETHHAWLQKQSLSCGKQSFKHALPSVNKQQTLHNHFFFIFSKLVGTSLISLERERTRLRVGHGQARRPWGLDFASTFHTWLCSSSCLPWQFGEMLCRSMFFWHANWPFSSLPVDFF